MSLSVIILAAGKGTRMVSNTPKVLHKLAHKPLLEHVYDTARQLSAEEIVVVYGHEGERVKQACNHFDAKWVEQKEQLGTGHAVLQAMGDVNLNNTILVLYGDVPLTSVETLQGLLEDIEGKVGLLTVQLENPFGYGRIIRDKHNNVTGIVEQKDASEEQQAIREVNSGILCCQGERLKGYLDQLGNNNSQGEYYLTDIFAMAATEGTKIQTSTTNNAYEVEGVNNRLQLSNLERIYQRNLAEQLMMQGVTIADPARLDIRGAVNVANDVFIDVNVILEGDVSIGSGSEIGANSIIINSEIAENVTVKANSIIENAKVESGCDIGPFARIRPDAHLKQDSRIGNFVEVKKSVIGVGSKVNHLSYIGDTVMGDNVNIGAGTITCNYDGANKHQTTIGDDVFVGSDTQLVAPVEVGKGVTIGAGTTLTKDVEENHLVISRAPQKSVKGWQRPKKK